MAVSPSQKAPCSPSVSATHENEGASGFVLMHSEPRGQPPCGQGSPTRTTGPQRLHSADQSNPPGG